MIPSQTSMKYVSYQLRVMQYKAERDAMVFERAEAKDEAL